MARDDYRNRVIAAMRDYSERERRSREARGTRRARSSAHGELVRAVISAISARGGVAVKYHVGVATYAGGARVRYGEPGFPDIVACLRGRFVAIECKTGSGRLQPNQARWRDRLVASGAEYLEARSVDQVIEMLDRLCA